MECFQAPSNLVDTAVLQLFPDRLPRRPRELEALANPRIHLPAQPRHRAQPARIDGSPVGAHNGAARVDALDEAQDERLRDGGGGWRCDVVRVVQLNKDEDGVILCEC